jgi:hypothetical protein
VKTSRSAAVANYDAKETELVPGALRGYRSWRLDRDWEHPGPAYNVDSNSLRACNWNHVWTPGVNPATCYLGYYSKQHPGGRGHKTPVKGCSCGIYAVHEPTGRIDGSGYIGGSIKAYGKILLGTDGFRASTAEIEALAPINPSAQLFPIGLSWLQEIGDRYQVPVFKSMDELTEAFPPISVDHLIGDLIEEERQRRELQEQMMAEFMVNGFNQVTKAVIRLSDEMAAHLNQQIQAYTAATDAIVKMWDPITKSKGTKDDPA